jgi:hypothetical protein
MPYEIHKQGNVWIVTNKDTGKSHGKHDSREKAMKQMRLLYGVENGMKPKT